MRIGRRKRLAIAVQVEPADSALLEHYPGVLVAEDEELGERITLERVGLRVDAVDWPPLGHAEMRRDVEGEVSGPVGGTGFFLRREDGLLLRVVHGRRAVAGGRERAREHPLLGLGLGEGGNGGQRNECADGHELLHGIPP